MLGLTGDVDDVITQIIAYGVGIPAGPPRQVLQPIRGGRAAVLGNGSAILSIQARDHLSHQLTGMTQRLISGETRRDPINHGRELRQPPIHVYAMKRRGRG